MAKEIDSVGRALALAMQRAAEEEATAAADVADALLLREVFGALWSHGVTVVAAASADTTAAQRDRVTHRAAAAF